MGIYGRIVYGYLWSYCLWVFMVVLFMGIYGRIVYGFGEPFWCIQRYIRGRETENIYFGGEIYIRNTPPYFLLSLLSSREEILSLFLPLSPYIT